MAPLLTDVEKIFYLAAQSRTSVGVYETSPLSLEPISNRRNVRNEGTFSLKAVKAMLFLILFFSFKAILWNRCSYTCPCLGTQHASAAPER